MVWYDIVWYYICMYVCMYKSLREVGKVHMKEY